MNRPLPVLKLLASAAFVVAVATAAPTAGAEPPPPVDVVIKLPPPPRRYVTVEWNPLALVLTTLSANLVVAPINHHALVVSPFYTWVSTAYYGTSIDRNGNALANANGAYSLQVPSQRFRGFGGEIGYRYYVDEGGPRGFFAGPSLRLASITGSADTSTGGNGKETSFLDYGFAVDAGYEMLVADEIAVSFGGGVQYVWTSKSIPSQQFPASVYADQGFRPRLLFSLGYAF